MRLDDTVFINRYHITKDEFIRNFHKKTYAELAGQMGFERQVAIRLGKKLGLINKKRGGYKKKKDIPLNNDMLEKLYIHVKPAKLAQQYGMSLPTLLRIVKERGIKTRKMGRKQWNQIENKEF